MQHKECNTDRKRWKGRSDAMQQCQQGARRTSVHEHVVDVHVPGKGWIVKGWPGSRRVGAGRGGQGRRGGRGRGRRGGGTVRSGGRGKDRGGPRRGRRGGRLWDSGEHHPELSKKLLGRVPHGQPGVPVLLRDKGEGMVQLLGSKRIKGKQSGEGSCHTLHRGTIGNAGQRNGRWQGRGQGRGLSRSRTVGHSSKGGRPRVRI